jgi:hypothetical protein
MKSSFAPLRPRTETNVVRGPTNRVIAAPPANNVILVGPRTSAEVPAAVNPLTPDVPTSPVPAAFTRGTGDGAAAGASILGRVTLRGTPPPEKTVVLDALCGRLHPGPITTRHYVVGDDAGLANVFVYVKSGIASKSASQSSVLVLEIINCEFQPYILGARAGQPFIIRNSDPMLENVHVTPRVSGNSEFNIGMPVKGFVQRTFRKPEVFIQVKCETRPWMFAYIGIVDHPWFAVTDSNGNFTLPSGLPSGHYTIAAVHPKAGESIQKITVGEGTTSTISFTLDVPDALAKTNAP